MFSPRFLVISLGNPLPTYASLHSAGHFVLNGLPKVLRQPTGLQESTIAGKPCMVSRGPKYTLVQSPTLMNVSGGFVQRAFQQMAKELPGGGASLGLVLVHDELEKEFGAVSLVPWERSPRGHNGVKSVRASLRQEQWPDSPLARCAVGIGRPEGRDSRTVSGYVLAPISAGHRRHLEEETPHEVMRHLLELEEEWAGVSAGKKR